MAEITYHNRGAIRSQPLSPKLEAVLRSAADSAGIDTVMVMSGGQSDNHTPETKGKTWTGSHRHDDGNAGDLQIVVNGRTLNFNNPADQVVFSNFARAAAAYGATGIGAGLNYMGPNRIHVGFGTKHVWGGTGKNPPPPPGWLKTAVNSGWGSPQAVGSVQPSGGTIIGRGSSKDDVSSMQAALRLAGHDPGNIDGVFGPQTERAVKSFQAAAGLDQDGKPGPLTLGALQQAVTSSTVGQVFGKPGAPALGYSGPQTRAAIPTTPGVRPVTSRVPQSRPPNIPRPRPMSPAAMDYVGNEYNPLSSVRPPAPTIRAPAAGTYPTQRVEAAFGNLPATPTLQGSATAGRSQAPSMMATPFGVTPRVSGTAVPAPRQAPGTAAAAPIPVRPQLSGGATEVRSPPAIAAAGDPWRSGAILPAHPVDRMRLGAAVPNNIPPELALEAHRQGVQIRNQENAGAWWNTPPSVGAGLTTPSGLRSPEAFPSARPAPPPAGFEGIWDRMVNPAPAAPRAMNYAPSPGAVAATPASKAIAAAVRPPDNMGNPYGSPEYGTGRRGSGATNAPQPQAGGLGNINWIGVALSGGRKAAEGARDFALSQGPLYGQALGAYGDAAKMFATLPGVGAFGLAPTVKSVPLTAVAPTPRSVLQTPPGQAISAVAPGQASAFIPRPVTTMSFPGLQQNAPMQFAPNAPIQQIATRAMGQLQAAQPPPAPTVKQGGGQPGIAPSRAAGGRTFNPTVASIQKSLRDANVTDYEGRQIAVDGFMGPRTASAMQKAGISIGGTGTGSNASGLRSVGVAAPSVSRPSGTTTSNNTGLSRPSVSVTVSRPSLGSGSTRSPASTNYTGGGYTSPY